MTRRNVRETITDTTKSMKSRALHFHERTRSAIERQGIGFIVALIIFFFFGLIFFFVRLDSVYSFVLMYGLVGIFLLTLFTDLLVTPFGVDIPLIIVFLSPEMNHLYAFFAAVLGVTVAVIIAYYIGMKWGVAGIEGLLGKKRYEKFSKHKEYGKIYMFISSITPLPFIPYLAGIYGLTWKECFFYLIFPRAIRYGFYWVMAIMFGSAILSWF